MQVSLFGFPVSSIFGFNLPKKPRPEGAKSFVAPTTEGGAVILETGVGAFSQQRFMTSVDDTIKDEFDLINRYREMANYPEVDYAIDDIVNEIFVQEEDKDPVVLNLDKVPYSEELKDKIRDAWTTILKLLDFKNRGSEIIRQWYVDGKIYFHKVIDIENPSAGLTELRYIDPRQIRKLQIVQKVMSTSLHLNFVQQTGEYYIFNEFGVISPTAGVGTAISADSIVFCTSGRFSADNQFALSYLHKALMPLNLLKMMEQATVIYRIVRAPERRAFYIDIGDLPPNRGKQVLEETMEKYRSKVSFNSQTGELIGDNRVLTAQEDFWLARRNGQNSTEIQTLEGGKGLGEMEEVEYYLRKLYKALNVPSSRMDPNTGFNMGRVTEISRDEVKFTKFVRKLRNRLARHLLLELLKTQLILQNVTCEEDWQEMKDQIQVLWNTDSYFAELKEQEIELARLERLEKIQPLIGRYYSDEYARKNVLKQSDEDIEREDELIRKEKGEPDHQDTTAALEPDKVSVNYNFGSKDGDGGDKIQVPNGGNTSQPREAGVGEDFEIKHTNGAAGTPRFVYQSSDEDDEDEEDSYDLIEKPLI